VIRILAGAPLIIVGEVVTTIGYRLAGAPHLNPHTRRSS